MKKKIVTFFILLISSLPIAAQNFRVGVTAGTNVHSFTNIDARMGSALVRKASMVLIVLTRVGMQMRRFY